MISMQDASAMQLQQQQQQEQHQYQMMQYAGEREHDPDEIINDVERTVLDFFNSDLNLEIARDGYVLDDDDDDDDDTTIYKAP